MMEHVVEDTSCLPPCTYKEYKLAPPQISRHNGVGIMLWPSTTLTFVEEEQLIYPLSSLVAEFGGTLSLFLGVSFMTMWDGLWIVTKIVYSNVKDKINI